ncbi:MAG: hypothetical protein ACJAWW_000902 [Sulfurimonas sp.]|jgi:hypothetical protein
MLKKLGLITVCAASAFAMHNADLNINNKDLEFGVKFDVGQFNENVEPENILVGAKILHADSANSSYSSNSDMDDFLEVSGLVQAKVPEGETIVGLGIKFNATKNYSSVPLGLEVMQNFAFSEEFPMYARGSLYYAPEVLCQQDAKNFFEYRIEVGVQVMKNITTYLLYRMIDTNYESKSGGDINYNKSTSLGIKFAF